MAPLILMIIGHVASTRVQARLLHEKIAELELKVKRQADNVRQLETENDKLQTKTRYFCACVFVKVHMLCVRYACVCTYVCIARH